MAITSTLCNPTPWEVEFPYDQGIEIIVPAYGETNLTSMQQVDDFRPEKPGYETVKELMDSYGIGNKENGHCQRYRTKAKSIAFSK